ncbi:MAG: TRAFAC clade GTPase domain-containing protein [Candidatus Acidiferrales bacterium]
MTTPPQGPHVSPSPQSPPVVESKSPIPASDVVIDLPSGNELDALAATVLQQAQLTRLIVVAGPVKAGKTTLIATLHDLFQTGKIGDYAFAWSRTLPAFERRCHLSRIASERNAPDTERTPFGKVRYLHAQVSGPELPDGLLDLLFIDVSGEVFDGARDSISECQQLDFLKMADHFLLLMDCEKIIDFKKRNLVIHDAAMLLRSCLDSGMLSPSCIVGVLWTKYDFVAASGDGEHATFVEKAEEELRKQFALRVGDLSFRKVAARPADVKGLEFGHGVPELLREWATKSPRDRTMNLLPSERLGSRESEKFLERHFNATPK